MYHGKVIAIERPIEKGKDGKWYIRKRMLPYEVFNELYHRYSNLNEYGK